jgi:hypothetical protein
MYKSAKSVLDMQHVSFDDAMEKMVGKTKPFVFKDMTPNHVFIYGNSLQ